MRFPRAEHHFLNYAIGTLLQTAIIPLSMAIYTRLFTPHDYGKYTVLSVAAIIISTTTSQWLQQAIGRFLPGQNDPNVVALAQQGIVVALVAIGLLSGALCIAIYWACSISNLAINPIDCLSVFLLSSVLSVTSSFYGLLQMGFRSRWYTILKTAQPVLTLVVFLILSVYTRNRIIALLYGSIIAGGILVPMFWISLDISIENLGRNWKAICLVIKKYLTYGSPMTGWFVCTSLIFCLDRFIIARYRGSSEVGVYSAVYALGSGIVSVVATPLLLTLHPKLMKTWNERRFGDAIKLTRVAILAVGTVGVGMLACVELTRNIWAPVLLGREYVSGAVVIKGIILAGIIWQMGAYCHKILEFLEKTKVMLYWLLFCTGLNVGMNLAFIPKYGYYAAIFDLNMVNLTYAMGTYFAGHRAARRYTKETVIKV